MMPQALHERQLHEVGAEIVFEPSIVGIVIGRRIAFFVDQFTRQIVQEVQVRSRRGRCRMEALRDQDQVGIANGEDLLEVIVAPVVAMQRDAIRRIGAEVVGLVELRRAAITIMAMWRITGPSAARDIDFITGSIARPAMDAPEYD